MIDGQHELDGYLFGSGTVAGVTSVDRGSRTVYAQDTRVPGGDGYAMGIDTEDPPAWAYDLRIRTGAESTALEALEAIREAWEGRRSSPGDLSVLRFRVGGRERRVYGRPRRFREAYNPVTGAVGIIPVSGSFQLADPLVYEDAASTLELQLVETSAGELVLPAVLPWTFGRAAGQRQGIVSVGGQAPVPFEVRFEGPVSGYASGLWAEGDGWRIDLDTQLAFDQSVTVDTRTHTVTRQDGLSLAGAARGRFLKARLRPGLQDVSWGATDPTNTARAVFSWRSGYRTI